jgi:peptidyl-prolyl cis-trans isomerase SurA
MRRSLVLVALALVLAPASAHARTLDRVVGIAGDHVILLGEVQARAKPYIYLATRQQKDPLALARLTTKALRETCERLIDEVLLDDEARRQHLVVGDDEVDRAIASVATDNNLTLDQLYAEARNQGYDPTTYRAEIAHVVLEYKLAQRHANSGESAKVEAARKAVLAELRARVYVEDRLAP